MPELPEVETVRQGLAAAWVGQRIATIELRRPDLRFPMPENFRERVEGRVVKRVCRRAKYIVADLSGGLSLVVHLGMSGSFRLTSGTREIRPAAYYHAKPRLQNHDHVVLGFSDGSIAIYNDPRRFGFMLLIPTAQVSGSAHFAKLGLEPLDGTLDAQSLSYAMAGRKVSLKAALLDQTIIAGLGNIYVSEALHRAGLSPRRGAWTLARKDGSPTVRAGPLASAIVDVLTEAVEAGGSTLRDFSSAAGVMGYFQHRFRVYGRAELSCMKPGCGGTIKQIVQNGRSTYYCPRCQH